MFLQFKRFFLPLWLDDEEFARRASLLRVMLRAALAITVVFGLIVAFVVPTRGVIFGIVAFLVIVLGSAWFLLKRGRLFLASTFVIFLLWAHATVTMLFGDGVGGTGIGSQMLVVVIAVLMLNGRAGVTLALLSVLTSALILAAQLNGFVPPRLIGDTLVSRWVVQSAYMVAAAVLVVLINSSLTEAIARARAELAERRRAEREIHRLNAELAKRNVRLEVVNHDYEAASAAISRQIREPVRSLKEAANALQREHFAYLPTEAVDYLRRIREDAAEIERLTGDLDALARSRMAN
jgi:signal transduction histidine kinase